MRRPRVIISTDIGGSDPDDFQSLVHYLVYADLVDTEALISSPPYLGRKEHILETLEQYRKDYDCLKTWGAYPTYNELVSVTFQGALETGGPGPGKATEGSKRMIDAAMKDDPRPLYILAWGSMTDIAQALYDQPKIKQKIRVYAIGSWNTAQDQASRDYIDRYHPDLWWIENDTTFRGMYMGGRQEEDLGNISFVEQHIAGHGALGSFFCEKKRDIKMGDTPSVLYILSSFVGDVGELDNPEALSWGGAFLKVPDRPSYWRDNPCPELVEEDRPGAKTVNRWREQYLRDWQIRMDRCTSKKQLI